jgi:restriction system protein
MPEITRKRTGELLRKLFEILAAAPEGLPAGVALDGLAAQVKLTPYEAGIYESSGTRRFDRIVRFATFDCVKAGWLLKHKGVWTLTEAGLEAYRAWPEPEAFYREAVRLYRRWRTSQPGEAAKPPRRCKLRRAAGPRSRRASPSSRRRSKPGARSSATSAP